MVDVEEITHLKTLNICIIEETALFTMFCFLAIF